MKSHNSENIQKADIVKVNKKRVVIIFRRKKKGEIKDQTSRGEKHCEEYGTSGKSTPPQKKIPSCGTLPIKAFGRDYLV